MVQETNLLDRLDDLPAAFRFVRAARRKSLREVEAECGVGFNSLSRLESGVMPTVENMRRVAGWLAGE